MDYLEFHQKTTDGLDELSSQFDQVTDMYTMMDQYTVEVPEEEYALYQTLKPSLDKLKEVITTSESTRDDSILLTKYFIFYNSGRNAKIYFSIESKYI